MPYITPGSPITKWSWLIRQQTNRHIVCMFVIHSNVLFIVGRDLHITKQKLSKHVNTRPHSSHTRLQVLSDSHQSHWQPINGSAISLPSEIDSFTLPGHKSYLMKYDIRHFSCVNRYVLYWLRHKMVSSSKSSVFRKIPTGNKFTDIHLHDILFLWL